MRILSETEIHQVANRIQLGERPGWMDAEICALRCTALAYHDTRAEFDALQIRVQALMTALQLAARATPHECLSLCRMLAENPDEAAAIVREVAR